MPEASPPGWRLSPVLLAWLLLGALFGLPYLHAARSPPEGQAFVGTFHFIDDVYQYLSFAEQAEGGAFLLRNKLVPERPDARLVNLEFWGVGRLAAATGLEPPAAFRLWGLLLGGVLLWGTDRLLVQAGLPGQLRLPALLLVGAGGGPGGLLFSFTPAPIWECHDLSMGLFPFLALLSNPHWITGTGLLVALLAVLAGPASTGRLLLAGLIGTVLGLSRPHDLGLACAAVVLVAAARLDPRELLPLATWAPVLLYDLWVFRDPAFAFHGAIVYARQSLPLDLLAVLPALLLAGFALTRLPRDPRPVMLLLAWVGASASIALLFRSGLGQQFKVGVGLPLLALGALGLARVRGALLWLALPIFSISALVAVRIAWRGEPEWFVPAARMELVRALRQDCRPGDRLVAPPEIGLLAIGLTACEAWVSHEAAPGAGERFAEVAAFYGSLSPPARADYLDRSCATHLVLPARGGLAGWIWPSDGYRQVAAVGEGDRALAVYARTSPCGR